MEKKSKGTFWPTQYTLSSASAPADIWRNPNTHLHEDINKNGQVDNNLKMETI